jgi:hypothetical protein
MESATMQYANKGLKTIIISDRIDALRRAQTEWRMPEVLVQAARTPQGKLPLTFLVDRQGRMLYRWEGYTPAKDIVFAVRKLLGPPGGVNQD